MRSDEFTKEVSIDEKEHRLGLSPEAFSHVKLQRGNNQLRSESGHRKKERTELISWKPSGGKKKGIS